MIRAALHCLAIAVASAASFALGAYTTDRVMEPQVHRAAAAAAHEAVQAGEAVILAEVDKATDFETAQSVLALLKRGDVTPLRKQADGGATQCVGYDFLTGKTVGPWAPRAVAPETELQCHVRDFVVREFVDSLGKAVGAQTP